jgi:hypothetical protein
METYISAIASSLVTNSLYHPFDALRIKIFFKEKTIKNLYNGITFNCLSNAVERSAIYPTQQFIKSKLSNYHPVTADILSGMGSGIVLAFMGTPFNAVRTIQMSTGTQSVISSSNLIYNEYGINGFYRGLTPTIRRDIVWTGSYFPIFSYLNQKYNNIFVSSMAASIIAMVLAYPMEGMRLMRQNINTDINLKNSFRETTSLKANNVQALALLMIREPLNVATGRYVYLKCNKLIKME